MHRRQPDPRRPAAAVGPVPGLRSVRAPRRPGRRTPPPDAARRARAPAPRRDRATAHRRRRTAAVARRPPPTSRPTRPDRRESDPACPPPSARMRWRAHHAGDRADAGADPASARTAVAGRRTPAPSRTRLRRPARLAAPTQTRSRTRATPSCPPRAPLAPPGPGSHPRAPPPAGRRVSGTHCAGQATLAAGSRWAWALHEPTPRGVHELGTRTGASRMRALPWSGDTRPMPYALPQLPYRDGALEPSPHSRGLPEAGTLVAFDRFHAGLAIPRAKAAAPQALALGRTS